MDLGLHVSTMLTARSQDALSQDVSYDQQFDRLLKDFGPFHQCSATFRAINEHRTAKLTLEVSSH